MRGYFTSLDDVIENESDKNKTSKLGSGAFSVVILVESRNLPGK